MAKYSFKDKVAIVTGSNQGIGKEIAVQLAKRGAKVVLNARNKEKLALVQKEFSEKGYQSIAISGDVSKTDDNQKLIEETFKTYGKIDILINNAALAIEGKIESASLEAFQKAFDVNVIGQIDLSQRAIPYLRETKGSIVFSGSIAGIFGLPDFSAYASTKMALNGIAEALRTELSIYDIHVGIVFIGFTENDPDKTFINDQGEPEPIPARKGFKKLSREHVALAFLKVIRKRKFKVTLSLLGKLLACLKRFIPRLFAQIVLITYKRKSKKA